ncbi:hypothetical protein [uncultured Pseudoteredinibacter sp.]|uniref:hypothetical protein n=1 Tax=uncultured Pseudoteredinibacter sp. TaxID=1641701 RepID=UPI002632276C|nr:hypothetical protein [uncultured Pseudoteredinibacter sp.]
MHQFAKQEEQSQQALSQRTKFEFFAVIIFLLLLAVGSIIYKNSSSAPYYYIPISELKKPEMNVFYKGQNTYLVFALDDTDPPLVNMHTIDKNPAIAWRVFAVDSRYGHILLAYKKHRYPSVNCPNLKVEKTGFRYNGRFLKNGIRCIDTIERWKQDTFVYDLQGKSHNKFIADLYRPKTIQTEKHIRISL